jgi:hypothetical protein
MSSRSPQTSRTKRSTARRPNKAQQRASQVRAAQTVTAPPTITRPESTPDVPVVAEESARPVRRERMTSRPTVRPRPVQSRVVARPVGMTRDQEYATIKADLVRLLVTFGFLMVLMLVLLLVIGQ